MKAGICVATFVAALTGVAIAQAPNAKDISGYWELTYMDSQHVPRAQLSPRVTRAVLDAQTQKDFKAVRWCNILGMPAIMASPRPLDIRQTEKTVVIAAEINAATRYIYLNRTAHISKDVFDPTTNGDSIAKWEGDTLVVDTRGFNAKVWLDQLGKPSTEALHVTTRFRRKDFGHMDIQITIDDPKAYSKPWGTAVEVTLQPNTELMEFICLENEKDTRRK